MRIKPIAWLAVPLLALSGCSSGTADGSTGSTVAPDRTEPTAVAPAENPPFRGIVLIVCGQPQTTLTAVDPDTHGVNATRTFSAGDGQTMNCDQRRAKLLRQVFDTGFTKVATTVPASDGGGHIGYLAIDGAAGTEVDLTPAKGSGYGDSAPTQANPVFNPATGRLWFTNGDGFGSVDVSGGPGSNRAESPATIGLENGGTFYFSTDGRTAIGIDTFGAVSADASTQVLYDPAEGFRIGDPKKDDVEQGRILKLLPDHAPAPGCGPADFLNADQFLCAGDGTQDSPNGVFLMTLNSRRTTVTQTALLPASQLAVLGAVADPSGKRLAVIARDRAAGTTALYATASVGGEPVKVLDLGESNQFLSDAQLLTWSK
jgi:hypothetical protein